MARLILLPIEESARLTFSSLAADLGQQTSGEHGSGGGLVKPTARQRAAVATLERQLDQVLMLVTVVGTVVVTVVVMTAVLMVMVLTVVMTRW